MSTLSEFQEVVFNYSNKYRRSDFPPLRVSSLYDLFPQNNVSHPNVDSSWPSQWPNSDEAGVYLFLNGDLELLYIGKASMKNTLGSRLNAYCRYDAEEQCKLINRNWKGVPRYILTIAVPTGLRFEAPALEEFLIANLNTTDNKAGI